MSAYSSKRQNSIGSKSISSVQNVNDVNPVKPRKSMLDTFNGTFMKKRDGLKRMTTANLDSTQRGGFYDTKKPVKKEEDDGFGVGSKKESQDGFDDVRLVSMNSKGF